MSRPRKPKVGFSYLLALAVVSFSRFAWLPWIVLYLHQRKYNTWTSTVSSYGLILSCYQIGQYMGGIVTNSKMLNSSWFTISFMALTGSFIALCFVTRITIVLLLFALMGFSGTVLSGVSINIDTNVHQMAFLRNANESLTGDALERNLTGFAFVILLAGYLYDSRPLVQLPMYSLASALALFCILVFAYFLIVTRTATARLRNAATAGAPQPNNNQIYVSAGAAGTSAYVSDIECGGEYTGAVPANFLSACGGSLAKARAMYGKTLQWRKLKRVDDILDIPQEYFHDIVKYYPHAIHGYSLDGCAVVYETLGKGDMAGLKRLGTSIDQIVWHFELRNELVFQRLLEPDFVRREGGFVPDYAVSADPNVLPLPVRRLMTVLDVGGISFGALTGDVITFIKLSGELIDNHYPEQVARLVICNAPSWFAMIWRVLVGVLPESVRKKIEILHDSKGLDKFIHPSQRPVEYAGTGPPLGSAAGHREFLALERRWRERGGVGVAVAATPQTSATAVGSSQHGSTAPTPVSAPVSTVSDTRKEGGAVPTTAAPEKKKEDPWKNSTWGKCKPTPAHLGEENAIEFNPSTGQWLDKSRSTMKVVKGKVQVSPASRLQEQVNEHAMMLAIDAAHQVRREGGGAGAGGRVSGGAAAGMEEGLGASLHSASFHEGDDPDERRPLLGPLSAGEEGGGGGGMKLSPALFLLVVTGHLFCHWIQTTLFTLIPVWMVIPGSAGGMEYSVREVSLVLSSAAVFALVGHKLIGRRCEQILKASPVRSLRIGCGLLLVVLLLLPSFMEFTARPADLAAEQEAEGDDTIQFVKVFGKELPAHVPVSYSTFAAADHHNVAYDYVYWASSKYTFHHRSILALQVPALLLAIMLCALQLCRRASGVLLHLTLASSFQKPSSVRHALNGCVDIAGPTLAALLFSLLYGMRLQYPLDASSFFSLSGCTILLVYIGTMLLHVQFRGDYGVMPDYQEPAAFVREGGGRATTLDGGEEFPLVADGSTSSSLPVYQRSGRRDQQDTRAHLLGGADSRRGVGDGTVGWLKRVFAVPISDANLLCTPLFAAYGSKLYNLKDDFKDL